MPAGISQSSRDRDLFELAVGYLLVLVGVWTPPPYQTLFFWMGITWVVLVTVLAAPDRRSLGLRLLGLRRSLWIVPVAGAIAAAAALFGWRAHTLHVPLAGPPPQMRAWGYILWAFAQQFILQDYFLTRLLRILPSKSAAVVVAATLFAVAHLPNPLLTAATLFWGAIACTLFLRYRDLYSLGFAHAILGLCIAFAVPNTVHHQMRVGLGYLHWHPRTPPIQRSQSNQMVSTSEWVIAEANSRYCARHALP